MRARQGRYLSKFPLLYSYMGYVLGGSVLTMPVYFFAPKLYPSVYWFFYLIMIFVEFAVLTEGSDHMFSTYELIRPLGRLLAGGLCLVFSLVYIIPALTYHRPSSAAFIDLYMRVSLTKAILIVVLLAAAHMYRVPVGKNISGMMLGFALFLSANIANAALAEGYGPRAYAKLFTLVEPLGFISALTIWTVAFWRYEPVLPAQSVSSQGAEDIRELLSDRMQRMNNQFSRLFKR